MKISCVVCGEDVVDCKTISCAAWDKLYLNLDGLTEIQQDVVLRFGASKSNIHQRMKIFHFDCFNEVCGEDFKF